MRKIFTQVDWLLILATCFLVIIGTLMAYSTSAGKADQYSFALRQVIYALVGVGLGSLVIVFGYRFFTSWSWFFYLGLILLLAITFILGVETRGSTRWIDFGFFTLQGSEIAKPVLVAVLASFLTRFAPQKLLTVIISLIFVLIPTLLVFVQPDLGSAVILGLIWFGLIYLSGVRLTYFVGLISLFLVSLPIGFNLLKGYQRARLMSFLNPTADPLGAGYNVVQSIIAVGSGQFWGRGFGRGTQSHLNFLPEQKTDFIFATTAEELGFIGIAILLILFAVIIWRLLYIASRAKTKQASLLCYGAAIVICAQVFINAGMNMGLLPVTGITLPFVSFGGSSLVSMLLLVALAQSVHIEKI